MNLIGQTESQKGLKGALSLKTTTENSFKIKNHKGLYRDLFLEIVTQQQQPFHLLFYSYAIILKA